FRGQEYEDEEKIMEFCTLTYGVKFPMFERVHVVGDQATPLFRDLADATGHWPRWNFHKYLVGRDGKVIGSWESRTSPEDPRIVEAIERALRAPVPADCRAELRLSRPGSAIAEAGAGRDNSAPCAAPAARAGVSSRMHRFARGAAALCLIALAGAGAALAQAVAGLAGERQQISYVVGMDIGRSLA